MIKISNYAPVAPKLSKLDQVLSWCVDLTDESKEKVTLITDIGRLGKLLEKSPIGDQTFYILYDMPISLLEAIQHNIQVEWNTKEYFGRVNSSRL